VGFGEPLLYRNGTWVMVVGVAVLSTTPCLIPMGQGLHQPCTNLLSLLKRPTTESFEWSWEGLLGSAWCVSG